MTTALASPETESTTAPRRVLVVDDDVDTARLTAALLEKVGYEAHPVFGAHEALAEALRWSPHIVLLDIGLPGMDGYELATRLRHSPGGDAMHLIALTAYSDDAARARTREAGCECHLVKGVELETLLEALDAAR